MKSEFVVWEEGIRVKKYDPHDEQKDDQPEASFGLDLGDNVHGRCHEWKGTRFVYDDDDSDVNKDTVLLFLWFNKQIIITCYADYNMYST